MLVTGEEKQMAVDAFSSEVLSDGPIGYWRLGEPVGSVIAADGSGNGNNGASSGPITFGEPGFHGGDTAALFTSATLPVPSPRIIVPNSNSLNPANITMEAKVRWDGPNEIQQRIIEKSSFRELAQYGLSVLPDGHVRVEIRTSSATISVDVNSVAVLSQGVESHLVATYDGAVIRIYINGVLDSEAPAPGSVSPKPPTDLNLIESGVGIGNQTQRDRPFNGLIDEVALYPSALSAERVLAHFRSQVAEQVTFQYATKVVCGKSDGSVVAPGTYFTAVNVHNPLYARVRFRIKVATALPGLRAGPVSPFHDVELGADEALEIDCPDILKLAGAAGDFLKGFVVLESSTELDVVAVYTAAGGDDLVEVLHMERVPARRLAAGQSHACVDFEPPIAVGTQYGAPAGQPSGTVVITTNAIAVAVADFEVGGNTFFDSASVVAAPPALGTGQVLQVNNISLDVDFSALPFAVGEVRFDYLDLGGTENLGVNGSSVFAGELASAPASVGGVAVSVTASPVAGGTRGTVVLTGSVTSLRVGGQELWIDNICASG
jgi:concanavalin A-like lectin/glucanase superfamily protein